MFVMYVPAFIMSLNIFDWFLRTFAPVTRQVVDATGEGPFFKCPEFGQLCGEDITEAAALLCYTSFLSFLSNCIPPSGLRAQSLLQDNR